MHQAQMAFHVLYTAGAAGCIARSMGLCSMLSPVCLLRGWAFLQGMPGVW